MRCATLALEILADVQEQVAYAAMHDEEPAAVLMSEATWLVLLEGLFPMCSGPTAAPEIQVLIGLPVMFCEDMIAGDALVAF